MKRKAIGGLALLIAGLTNYVAFAAETGEVTASTLNIRAGAATTYSVIGKLQKGTKVAIYEKTNNFYRIEFNNKKAYISQDYVKVTPEQPTYQVETTSASSGSAGEVTASTLNVRSGAGNTFAIKGKLTKGTKITVYEKNNNFYRVNYNGAKCYVSQDYIKLTNNAAPTKTTTPTSSTTSTNTSTTQLYTINGTTDDVINYAKTFLGTPYVWGGESLSEGGFDCSGYVQFVYKHFNISLPRITYDQIKKGTPVSFNDLKVGDLVFFSPTPGSSDPTHVGMYIGNNQFIHAPKTGDVVKISDLTYYYKDNFIIGRRLVR